MVLRNKVNGHVMFNHQMNEWTWLKDKGVDESEKKKKKKKQWVGDALYNVAMWKPVTK